MKERKAVANIVKSGWITTFLFTTERQEAWAELAKTRTL